MNELDRMLQEQIKQAVQDALAKAMPETDRNGLGSKNVIGSQEVTLESDPMAYLTKRAKEIARSNGREEWADDEKAVIGGVFHRWMTQDMRGQEGE